MSTEQNFKPAKCPNCNGELQIPDNKDFIICMYCGSNVKVRDAIVIYQQNNIPNWIELANNALNSGNDIEAYKYYDKILEVDINNLDAWIGKGLASARQSTLANIRIPEQITCSQKAFEILEKENDNEKNKIKKDIIENVITCCLGVWELAKSNLSEFISLESTWPEYLNYCLVVIDGLSEIKKFDIDNADINNLATAICVDCINGRTFTDDINNTTGRKYLSENQRNMFLSILKNFNERKWREYVNKEILESRKKVYSGLGLVIFVIIGIIYLKFIADDSGFCAGAMILIGLSIAGTIAGKLTAIFSIKSN